jgi:hypothetical protein
MPAVLEDAELDILRPVVLLSTRHENQEHGPESLGG